MCPFPCDTPAAYNPTFENLLATGTCNTCVLYMNLKACINVNLHSQACTAHTLSMERLLSWVAVILLICGTGTFCSDPVQGEFLMAHSNAWLALFCSCAFLVSNL